MPLTDDFNAQVDALSTAQLLVRSETSGPSDACTSLHHHLDRALGLSALFPTLLRDDQLYATVTESLATPRALAYLNQLLRRPRQTPASQQQRLYFYSTLAARLTGHTGPTHLAPGRQPYAICSLAQALRSQKTCLTHRDYFIAAALLCGEHLPAVSPAPRAPAPETRLDDYLEIPTLLQHQLAPRPGVSLVTQLFNTLDAGVYYQGNRYRPPTRRERQAGIPTNHRGMAILTGASLNAPPAQALDALLHSDAFARWAQVLARSLELPAGEDDLPQCLALAEQALVDLLYPPEKRRVDYILDFKLFDELNAELPLDEIRLDLTNSVQRTLKCLPAIAELASELLMRRFAPELLLEGQTEDFAYEPGLQWSALRQGAMLCLAEQQPLTFQQADLALARQAAKDTDQARHASQDTLAAWAQLNGVIDQPTPWSTRQWQQARDSYLTAWEQDDLRDLPNRFDEAQRRLRLQGIDPDGLNVDGKPHLEAYLDHGAGYRHKPALPDMNAWFETAFTAWETRAKATYQGIFKRFVPHLPEDAQDQLRDTPWSAFTVAWPRYRGPIKGAIPSYSETPADHWQLETGTQGLLVRVPGQATDTLYELFPERLEWRMYVIKPIDERALGPHLSLRYGDYNQTRIPWDVHDSAVISRLAMTAQPERLLALGQGYAASVALGNRLALHTLGKGATPYETFLAKKRETSLDRYLLKLFSSIVPLISCFDVRSGEDALGCALDAMPVWGKGIAVGGRVFKPLGKLKGASSFHRSSTRAAARQVARRTASQGFSMQPVPRPTGLKRWHSAPELQRPNAWLDETTTQDTLQPGQTPDIWKVDQQASHPLPSSWEQPDGPQVIARDAEHVDAIVNGAAYRYAPQAPAEQARRLQHTPLLTSQGPALVDPPYPGTTATAIALRFAPTANDAGTPAFGQLASHAFQTVRIEPAPVRFRPNDAKADTWTYVMVREGKVASYTPRTQKPFKVVPAKDADIRLGIIAPPVYHRTIIAHPSAEPRFGLPDDLPAGQVALINRHCPPVRLSGLARSIPDRRTLRGAIVQRHGQDCLIVEADLGVFYGAPYTPSRWQQDLLDQAGSASLPQPPRNTQLKLTRIKDSESIEDYLSVSETYRLVASRPNLQHDIDNLKDLLHDWIEQQRTFTPEQANPFMEFLLAAEARNLPGYARNILTQTPAQDALAGLARKGVVGLNREIIPNWGSFSAARADLQARIHSVLDALLPAQGSTEALPKLSVTTLTEQASQLRKHLAGANLAFAQVTLSNGQRRVYFSLSGGSSRRRIRLETPSTGDDAPVRYIDAQTSAFDPRFTELSTLRRADFLFVKEHRRHLDSERLIASAINRDLLATPEQVKDIQVFSLLNACRSCGGFVLPRLRLDYPKAEFSLTWLQEYLE